MRRRHYDEPHGHFATQLPRQGPRHHLDQNPSIAAEMAPVRCSAGVTGSSVPGMALASIASQGLRCATRHRRILLESSRITTYASRAMSRRDLTRMCCSRPAGATVTSMGACSAHLDGVAKRD